MTDRDDTFPDPTRPVGSGGGGSAPDDLSGRLLDERYRVERKLGEGGMATVWLARDEKPGMGMREVAVKVPHAGLLAAPQARERFEREVRSLLEVKHPGVVKVLDVGRLGDTPFLVMEYLPGGSLGDRIHGTAEERRTSPRPSRPQAPAEVARWLVPLAATLDSLHVQDLVHRDVKPDNVLFDEHGNPYLGDFGIAVALRAGDPRLTRTGLALGSLRTMAPEQCRRGKITGAADQYALAATVYEALAGRPVVEGEDEVEVLSNKLSPDAEPDMTHVPDLPPAAAAALLRGLARDPGARHASCTALTRALREGLAATIALRSQGGLRRAALVLLTVAVLGAGVWLALRDRGEQRSGRAAAIPTATPAAPVAGAADSAPDPTPVPVPVVVTITEPADGAWVSSHAVPVSGTASGVSALRVNGRAVAVEGGAFATTATAAADGSLLVRVTGDDDMMLAECTVQVDGTRPVIEIQEPASESFTSPGPVVRVTGRVDEADLAELTVNGQRITPDETGAFTWPVPLEAGVETTLRFEARDHAGNEAVAVRRRLQYEKPAEAWEAPYSRAEEAGRKGEWREASRLLEEAIAKGSPSGAIAEWLRRGVADWNAPPDLQVTSPAEGARIDGTVVRVTGTLRTNRATDTLFVNGRPQPVADGRFHVEFDYKEDGEQIVELTVKDVDEIRSSQQRTIHLVVSVVQKFMAGWAAAVGAEKDENTGFPRRVRRLADGGDMVLLPAGSGTGVVGSKGVRVDRTPLTTRYNVRKAYYIDVAEVTNGQFRRFVDASGYRVTSVAPGHPEFQGAQGSPVPFGPTGAAKDERTWEYPLGEGRRQPDWLTHPVVAVSVDDALSFAAWAGCALPTYDQFEHARLLGAPPPRNPWGNALEPTQRSCNLLDVDFVRAGTGDWKGLWPGMGREFGREFLLSNSTFEDGYGFTAPVRSYPPTRLGIYDLVGNVAEWCIDVPSADYDRDEVRKVRAPASAVGAAWNIWPGSAYWHWCGVYGPDPKLSAGFRCVRQLP